MSGRLPTLVPFDFDRERAAERARQRFELAKAALTGLISLNAPGPHQRMPDEIIQSAWRWADDMLDAGDATAGPTSVSVPPSPATRPGEVE